MKMNRAEREQWILDYLSRRSSGAAPYRVNTIDRSFVERFEEATGAKVVHMIYGADRCQTLAQDLLRMYRAGKLKREADGVGGGMCHMGFPKWTWSYMLPVQPEVPK